ncbi:hypothetical protein CN683_01500 [Bacillus toyonensis]|uniref:Uncharacterized protein n=1 Tax=Bacillus toyonensis TaxID=155322 RepID=A0AB36SSY7_9BACI|nr:hypothetical protein [Bacillus toyonensis]PEB19866.1 hypothetical protein COO08_03390 [Bacillus toyonensis]PEF95118.1 hypothetical protein COO01_31150 [Bacillus toyonensis]PEJ82250.1 hypothetical protein CN891_31350 [Bacillus toyonensis]PEK20069.1 hypothetical protein CN683_01500 [Bacillus toyonensis]PEL28779.1 hypothetical protein CN623_25690 [Bacillus toyonensis]
MTGGGGCRLDEQLFLVFTFNCNSRCVDGEGLLLFFQLLNNIGVDDITTLGDWKKDKTSFTVIVV